MAILDNFRNFYSFWKYLKYFSNFFIISAELMRSQDF